MRLTEINRLSFVNAICMLQVLVLVTTPCVASAQETSVTSAKKAFQIVGRAAEMMGGAERLRAITTTYRQLHVDDHFPMQGPRPLASNVTDGPIVTRGEQIEAVDLSAGRAVQIRRGEIFGGQPLDFRTVVTRTYGFSANEKTRRIDEMSTGSLAGALARMQTQPIELLIAAVLSNPTLLRYTGEATVGETTLDVVAASRDGIQVDLYFDRTTGLPWQLVSVQQAAALGDYASITRYDDWRIVDGIKIPHMQERRAGTLLMTRSRITAAAINQPVADSFFVKPQNYDVAPERPESAVVAPGVTAILQTYNSLLVEFPEYFVVIEPGGRTSAAQRVLAEAKRLAANKPVKYVVATHFHDDHIAAVRPYIAIGAEILTTPHAAVAIRRMADTHSEFFPDDLALQPRPLQIREITDRYTIGDGAQRIDLYAFSNPHADQMLIAHIPSYRVLFEADMLDLDVQPGKRGLVGADTLALRERIKRLGLTVDTIVPAHGRIGTGSEL